MKNIYSKDNTKFISFSEFHSFVHWFTLRFKAESLEKEYPMKGVRPFDVIVLFKVLLWLLVVCIGARKFQLMIFAFFGVTSTSTTQNEEIINFSLFLGAILLEGLVYFCKPFRIARGFFIMAYIYFSIAYASYYVQSHTLFSVPMYF